MSRPTYEEMELDRDYYKAASENYRRIATEATKRNRFLEKRLDKIVKAVNG